MSGRVRWSMANKGYGFTVSVRARMMFLPAVSPSEGVRRRCVRGAKVECSVIDGRRPQAMEVSLVAWPRRWLC